MEYGCTQPKKGKRKLRKKKVPLRCFSPDSNNTITTKTTPELQAMQKRRLQKEPRRRPIKDLRFSP
jgi:hypothetical protein